MLASRGFSYLSEDTAGRQMQYHADCDCDIVPSWGSGKLKGYDPDKYREMYQAAKAAAGDDGDWRDALAQLRRIYHDEVNDGVTAQSTIRWSGRSIPISASELSRLSDYSVRMPGDRFSSDEKVAALMDWTGDSCKSSTATCSVDETRQNPSSIRSNASTKRYPTISPENVSRSTGRCG